MSGRMWLCRILAVAGMLCGLSVPVRAEADAAQGEWGIENGREFWYENGVRQGAEGRGKEIYDPDTDAWYRLDAVQRGQRLLVRMFIRSLGLGLMRTGWTVPESGCVMTKTTVFGMNCKTNTICRVLPYYPKKKSPSEYGDSGIYGISRSISGCSMSIC